MPDANHGQARTPSIEKRYFREFRVVFVRQLDEDHFEVRDKFNEPYPITKETLDRDFKEMF